MVSKRTNLKKSVELIKLKTDRLIDRSNFLLKEDIWENGTLIIKSGTYLTYEIINKLLMFGIKQVEASAEEIESQENYESYDYDDNEYSLKQFLLTQNVLIVEKNLINASLIAKLLIDRGFKSGNIFVTKEPSTINGYFRAKQFSFLFIDQNLYESSRKCVDKFSVLRNIHVFVLTDTDNLLQFKVLDTSKIKFLYKPAIEEKIDKYVLKALHQNYLDFWNNNEEEMEAMIS